MGAGHAVACLTVLALSLIALLCFCSETILHFFVDTVPISLHAEHPLLLVYEMLREDVCNHYINVTITQISMLFHGTEDPF